MSSTNKHDSDKDDEIEQCRVVPDEKYKKWNSNISSGNKFARRARSFKEDLLDILSAMRSPNHSAISSRSGSPKNGLPKQRHASSGSSPKRSLNDIDFNVRQVQIALRHFLDVVTKNKLEMLPGNGTVVLETVTTICGVFKSYDINEQSSLVVSALNQVYQSVAQLIKLCDDVLIFGEKAINTDNVSDILRLVELAIQNLVSLTNDKLNHGVLKTVYKDEDSLKLPDELKQRVSLPDIPLTPREREILEQTSNHSFDTVDCNPPSKPPLPDRTWLKKTDQNSSPPPLPPKRRTGHNIKHTLCNLSLEPLSLSDRSSSIGSLDSILNDDEVNIAMSNDDSSFLTNDVSHVCGYCNCSSSSASVDQGNEKRISPFSEYPPQHTMVEKKTAFIHQASNQVWTHSKSTTIHQITNRTVVSNEINCLSSNDEIPPPVPEKKRIVRQRLRSTYDNLSMDEMATQYNFHRNNSHCSIQALTHTASLDNPAVDPSNPPPLPLKKKHMFHSVAYSVMAYMEMFGNCAHVGNTTEFLRHSVHTYTMLHQSNWNSPQKYQSEIQSYSVENSCQQYYFTNESDPPALPPKRGKIISSPFKELTPPNSPNKVYITEVISTPTQTQCLEIQDVTPSAIEQPLQTDISEVNIMEELNVSQWLLFKKPEEDGPLVRGGHADALVVHATNAVKNDFMYQEAFLTTYRTFISPLELIQKLCMRHQRFQNSGDLNRQRAGRESFSLLVRVVSDLTLTDLDNEVLQILMDFVYQLLCAGDLTMAKALRVKLLERYQAKMTHNTSINALLPSQNIYTRQATLLDYKTELIAEQMTMLDSELFMKIEIPEVLIWVKEQNEERSPNLTEFTEHFNKMSYWARSRILEQNEAKERERYVLKFIKIMKSLRKMNNFNSYLALLSALDSAPIRRLEWQKYITEGLKEYCALIDSSSSFRAYRQALADTNPPCIPYIGLVLQDLTFVHIGNNDYISDNIINFSKRWQQFNIVENMKRFKKGCYNFKKHDHIIAFFNNFDEFLCEEAMWQISESIKPRGSKKTT
ncbi:guanine nucleotide-releasing factor 2 isoform X1 [Melanaphis sacchari]|uniref:guanine nucleotide-releasing factor 2 isoform X1 n=2 Tax=Melanaphis sacchari TaxID=742174 RepID=UPI000DC15AA0|nr:guanine nucleotide-releasing factor 2 isoform X1 [Melanaphis sacchari]XP_025190431.1 guanine nucleotide-releasing factor 2 isoform X1 [Melanaphis sacchari]XP_025190432.1 guanine nucleotide-releasing factor 2 isoform X1 [Melanaphis sacchari]XP_025190434.1 guanine nucleotide-releasing factor 2 isoform X1 [Melanaphis sacchari]